MRGTKEFAELMDSFEKACKSDYVGYLGCKVERIDPHGRAVEGFPNDQFYQNGDLNEKFKFYMMGYMEGRCVYMHD